MGQQHDPNINLTQFFEMSLDLLTVARFDGFFLRLNEAWVTTLGWSKEELLSRPSIEFVHPDDRAETLAGRLRLQDGVPLSGLVNRYLCKDGSHRWLEWRSVAYLQQGLVYGVARDITHQKEAEAEAQRVQARLIVADRLASIGRLASGVAHEINNPLAYIMANLRMVSEELRLPEPSQATSRDELSTILLEALHGSERIRATVRVLQTFSNTALEQRTVLDVRPVVELAVAVMAGELRRSAKLIERYGPTPQVEADSARLSQVLINLLLNASQAIERRPAAHHEIEISSATESGRAVIEVRDTGDGSSPGLGLSICYTVIAQLGGTLTVANEPGRGSTFRVELPAVSTLEVGDSPV